MIVETWSGEVNQYTDPHPVEPLQDRARHLLGHVLAEVGENPPLLEGYKNGKHSLGKLTGLYQLWGCTFNPHSEVPDITEMGFLLNITQEAPSRAWKYLTLARF